MKAIGTRIMAYTKRSKPARKVASKTVAPPVMEASRTPLEEDGKASDQLPESANGFEAGEMKVEPAPRNKDLPGTSGHQTVTLRRYEWLDILDTIEGTDELAIAYDRISKQIS